MPSETPTQLLDVAQALVQSRGYNAFSYKDLAEEVGIRTASIHYHFETKADLGLALMERYTDVLKGELQRIDRSGRSQKPKLKAFIALYQGTEVEGNICVCGSLAADIHTLPKEVANAVREYLRISETWVANTLEAGVRSGEFALAGRVRDAAVTLVSGLQGALIVSRSRSGSSVLAQVQRTFLASLATP